MKKTTLLLLAVLTCIGTFAQAPHIQWQKCYGGSNTDVANYIVQTADSGYIMTGYTLSADYDVTLNHGGFDYWVVKINSLGAITWQRSYGGSADDRANFIQQTSDGGYIVAGVSRSNDGDLTGGYGLFDYWVLKLTTTGAITWEHNYGGSDNDVLHCIRQTSDGGYILAGRTSSNDHDVSGNHGDDDVWIVKLNSTGGITWQHCYGGSDADDAGAIWETYDGGYYFAGNTGSTDGNVSGNHGLDDFWVAKISSTGSLIWQKCLGGSGIDDMVDDPASAGMQQTLDSGIILTGWSASTDGDVTGNHGNFDYWVVKLSDTGHIEWEHSYGGTGADYPGSLQQTADSGYIVTGSSASNDGDVSGNHGGYDYWTIKLSPAGVLQWQKCTGGTGGVNGEIATSVHETFDGGFVIAGGTNSNDSDVSGNHGNYDYWVVKLYNPITVSTPNTPIASISIIPNPARDELFIMGAATPVQSLIYNMTGQLVKQATGNSISLADLPPATYLIRVVDARGMLLKQERIIRQ